MPQKRYKPEEIIHKLRVAEVELSKGHNTGQICRKLGITEQTYYRWRKQYGGRSQGHSHHWLIASCDYTLIGIRLMMIS